MLEKKCISVILASLFLLIVPFSNTFADTLVSGEKGTKLDAIFSDLAKEGFSGAILIARDGQVVLKKAYGLANIEKKIPVTTDTVFYLASVSKHISAAAILKLESQGKLKTSDPISKYLDGVPEDKQGITIHHLLTHTSGLINMYGDYKEVLDRDTAVAKTLATELQSAPGKKWSYSNAAYNLVAAIIEKASGRRFVDFLKEEIFEPAGMTSTGTVYEKDRWPADQVALCYEGGWDNGCHLDWEPTWKRMGAGGIITNVEDMYRWHLALQGDKVLNAAAREKLFSPHFNTYGYGLYIEKNKRGLEVQQHSGSLFGFRTMFIRYPSRNGVLILLANSFGKIKTELSEIIAQIEYTLFEPAENPFDSNAPEELQQLAFWLGDWDFTSKSRTPDGSWTEGKGKATVAVALSGYGLIENFFQENVFEDGRPLHGMSITVFNKQSGTFHQHWTDNKSLRFYTYEGGVEGEEIILYSPEISTVNGSVLMRMVYSDIKPDNFTWRLENSVDNRKTWNSLWVINFTRTHK